MTNDNPSDLNEAPENNVQRASDPHKLLLTVEKAEEVSSLVKSQYATYLIDEKIKEIAKNKWNAWKAFIIPIGLLVLGVLGYFGYDFQKSRKAAQEIKDEYSKMLVELRHEKDSLENALHIISNYTTQAEKLYDKTSELYATSNDIQKTQLESIESNIDRALSYSNLYREFFTKEFQSANDLQSNLGKDIKTFTFLKDSFLNAAKLYQVHREDFEKVKDSVKSRIASLEQNVQITGINSTIRYVFAERSTRRAENRGKDEFRPYSLILPNSNDKLSFVFYSAPPTQNPSIEKTAMIDIYLNDKIIDESRPLEFDENRGDFTPRERFIWVNEKKYKVEPVFIYLPPNLIQRLPDFVVLKVSLVG